MTSDILGLPVSSVPGGGEVTLPPCPGRTVWDVQIAHWKDQATVRHLLVMMHEAELARAAKPPVLQVNITDLTSPISAVAINQDEGTMSFTVRKPQPDTLLVAEPVYPAPDLQFEDDTPTRTLAALNGETAELPAAIEPAPRGKGGRFTGRKKKNERKPQGQGNEELTENG